MKIDKVLEVDQYVEGITYFKPVLQNPKIRNKYAGLSIEDIETLYGVKVSRWVYFLATKGYDLTSRNNPKLDSIDDLTSLVIKIEYKKVGIDHYVYVITPEDKKILLFVTTIDDTMLLKEDVKRILYDNLYSSLKNIGVIL